MEIPDNLKHLYKHWKFHTVKPETGRQLICNEELLQQVCKVVTERMNIWERKQQVQQPPFTEDPILAKYRFCNIYRELDKQTIEIHTQLKSLEGDFDMWLLNVIFNRMVCNPNTVSKVGFLNNDENNNRTVNKKLINLPSPKYGVAYIFPISLVSKVGLNSREEFFSFFLPKVIGQCADVIKNFKRVSVIEALEKILPVFRLNFKFHWTEVLIDVAYQYPQYIDLFKEFPIGPGSIPTMKRLNPDRDPIKTNMSLTSVFIPEFHYLTYEGNPIWLSAENWEGIGCEFRKYSNLVSGNGRKRLFK